MIFYCSYGKLFFAGSAETRLLRFKSGYPHTETRVFTRVFDCPAVQEPETFCLYLYCPAVGRRTAVLVAVNRDPVHLHVVARGNHDALPSVDDAGFHQTGGLRFHAYDHVRGLNP